MERHRSYFLYYSGGTDCPALGDIEEKLIVYFAPEKSLSSWLQKQSRHLVAADFFAPDVDLRADLSALPFRNASIDVIINHHVLEHVPDDSVALQEFDRVLKPGGKLFISVPINENRQITWDWGFPDPLKQDHFRDYGVDFPQRLSRFEYVPVNIPATLSPEQVYRYGLENSELVFACRRRLSADSES
jgi:SAM-dependent methyltransferase